MCSERDGGPVEFPEEALTGSAGDFTQVCGADLLARTQRFFAWQSCRRSNGVWPYSRVVRSAPGSSAEILDDAGHAAAGVNFASQDYLGLSLHPAIRDTVVEAAHRFGVHSAGSAVLLGNTSASVALEEMIGQTLGYEHVLLFPTGWAAGYGVIRALVRQQDHVVMDSLSHACLQEGALAATPNVFRYTHLSTDAVRRRLREIRRRDERNGILVVTESLFSMDSDHPDLVSLQNMTREFNATLLVDCAHDLGAQGPGGTGQIGTHGLLGEIDLVMGSFSKTFASNGGFLACRSRAVREYVKHYSGPHTFSNALSPLQASVVHRAFEIVRSTEGQRLRDTLQARVVQLRRGFAEAGMPCLGVPSPIVPVVVGVESLARIASKHLSALGVLANLVEFPAVKRGTARFRLQVMASHSASQVATALAGFATALDAARETYNARRGGEQTPDREAGAVSRLSDGSGTSDATGDMRLRGAGPGASASG